MRLAVAISLIILIILIIKSRRNCDQLGHWMLRFQLRTHLSSRNPATPSMLYARVGLLAPLLHAKVGSFRAFSSIWGVCAVTQVVTKAHTFSVCCKSLFPDQGLWNIDASVLLVPFT